MISQLPNECLHEIFNYFNDLVKYRGSLFSCLLVNRKWCRIAITILWSKPLDYLVDERIIMMYFLSLNAEDQKRLIPLNIRLPKFSIPLFKYTTYATSIDGYNLVISIKKWLSSVLHFNPFPSELVQHHSYTLCKLIPIISHELVCAVKFSLIKMFLRKCNKLKNLKVYGIIDVETIEILNINTNLTSLGLECNDFDSEGIKKLLVDVLSTNTNLSSLDITNNILIYEDLKKLVETLCGNSTLTSLNLTGNRLGSEGGKIIVKFLCNNCFLTSLNLAWNHLGFEGGKALAKFLYDNCTLTFLNLSGNLLGSEGVKELAKALYKNNTLTSLDLSSNELGHEGAKALTEVLYINNTLTSLDLRNNKLCPKGAKFFAEALCKNINLTHLNLGFNQLGTEEGKSIAEALCKNDTLTFLDISNNNLNFEGGKALLDSLDNNTSLLVLILTGNKLAFNEESQFAVSIFDWPITIPCYELCCNNNYLTEELAKAGNRVINDNSCAINPPYLSTLDLDDFFPYFSVQ